ncbi:unnamed protein product, partial [Phaeothamnion confervicola]
MPAPAGKMRRHLDEAHTCGTNLELPLGVHVIVTLRQGLTRDWLVPACTRMPQLERGHTARAW